MQFWNELEGSVIEGEYPLHRLVRSEGRSAWFETQTSDGTPATISVTESITDDDEIVERLEKTEQLRQPHLVTIYKVGRAQVNDAQVVYAVMEHTDETLANVLRERALTREEAAQVAESVVDALTSIHQRGLVHGRVEPSSVLAAGETIKLRSDCIQPQPRNGASAHAPSDVVGLGATVFQAFTQRRPQSSDDPQINRLPAPFAAIVKNALSERWGLAQIASALRPSTAGQATVAAPPSRGPAPTPPPVAQPAVAVPARPAPPSPEIPVTVADGSALPAAGEPRPAPRTPDVGRWEPPPRSSSLGTEEERRPSSRWGIFLAGALVLLLFVGWFLVRPEHGQKPAYVQPIGGASQGGTQHENPLADHPAPPIAGEEHSTVAAHPEPAKPSPDLTQRSAGGARSVWRVVVYTYDRQATAQQKADQISQVHPELQAQVFSPKGDRGPYLVVLGGGMDRDQAAQMCDHARSLGLPRDTYMQNFSQ